MILAEGEDASAIKDGAAAATPRAEAPAEQMKAAQSAPPAAPTAAAEQLKTPAEPVSAVATPPKPQAEPEPETPERASNSCR